jgi:hypothetical protein
LAPKSKSPTGSVMRMPDEFKRAACLRAILLVLGTTPLM